MNEILQILFKGHYGFCVAGLYEVLTRILTTINCSLDAPGLEIVEEDKGHKSEF